MPYYTKVLASPSARDSEFEMQYEHLEYADSKQDNYLLYWVTGIHSRCPRVTRFVNPMGLLYTQSAATHGKIMQLFLGRTDQYNLVRLACMPVADLDHGRLC